MVLTLRHQAKRREGNLTKLKTDYNRLFNRIHSQLIDYANETDFPSLMHRQVMQFNKCI